jgi:hypothetical protein
MKVLQEKLATEPKLEGFKTYSPIVQKEIETAVADYEWVAKAYDGVNPITVISHFEWTEALKDVEPSITDTYTALETGATGWVDGAGTAAAAGGELADIAATLGLSTDAASVVGFIPELGLATAAGVVWWKDGEELMEVFSGRSTRSSSEPTFSLGRAVEGTGWERLEYCGKHKVKEPGLLLEELFNAGQGYAECKGDKGPGKFGEESTVGFDGTGGISASGIVAPDVTKPQWILLQKAGGEWLGTSVGFELDSIPTPWKFGDPSVEQAEKGCGEPSEGVSWSESLFPPGEGGFNWEKYIAGSPVHFHKVLTKLSKVTVTHHSCIPYHEEEVGLPPEVVKVQEPENKKGVTGMQTYQRRKSANLPMNLPHHKGTCPEGHTCPEMGTQPLPSVSGLRSKIGELNPEEDPEGEKWLDHFRSESPTKVPGLTTVPSCRGDTVPECEAKMELAGLVPEVSPLEWKTADVTIEPDHVVRTSPKEGEESEEAVKITIIPNPGEEGMPDEVPKIEPGEVYTEYKTRVETQGWTDLAREELPESEIDPHYGPDVVIRSDPKPGTRIGPKSAKLKPTTNVKVKTNPKEAPEEPGGLFPPPTLPGLHPPSLHLLCTTMPFGVPCWIIHQIEQFAGAKKTPEWTIGPIEFAGNKINAVKVSLSSLEPIMVVLRPFMILFSTAGLLLFFYKLFTGKSMAGGENPSGEVPNPEPHATDEPEYTP